MLETFSPQLVDELAWRYSVSVDLARVVAPLLALAITFGIGYAIERLLGLLVRASSSTATRLDDILAAAVRGPIRVYSILFGAGIGILLTPLSTTIHSWTRVALALLAATLVIVLIARVTGGLIRTYGERTNIERPTLNLARRLITVFVWTLGALLILQDQGINVTPLLTTLGLAGLAVALAFQDTLGNLFAGVYIQADRPMDVGHYVRLEDHNVEGYVVDVGWRTTKIRTLANNIVVIPNARVANSIMTDYDLPQPRMSLLVRVPVAPDSDVQLVREVVLDEARRAAREVEGILAEPEPFVRFIPGFTEWGREFTLIVQVRSFVDQYLAQDELRQRIDARLVKEGIALSTPHRTIRIQGGPAVMP